MAGGFLLVFFPNFGELKIYFSNIPPPPLQTERKWKV